MNKYTIIQKIKSDHLFIGICFFLPLAIYGKTLLPGVDFSDVGEFQAAAASLGVAHPGGYPFYIILGHLATIFIPFNNPAWRVNFLSALVSAAAAALTYVVIRRYSKTPWPGLITTLTLALTNNVWKYSLIAEPYSLVWFFVSLFSYLSIKWWETKNPRWVLMLSFLFGLACGGHTGIISFAIPLGIFLAATGFFPWKYPKHLLLSLVLLIVGLSIYLYIPLRARQNPPLNYGNAVTVERAVDLISAKQFRWLMFAVPPQQFFSQRIYEYRDLLMGQFPWPFLAVILLNGSLYFLTRRRQWPLLLFIVSGWILTTYVWLDYSVPDFYRYITPSFWLIGWFGGFGLVWLEGKLPAKISLLLTIGLIGPVSLFVLNFPLVDQSGNHAAETAGREILSSVRPHAVIMSWWPYSTILWYLIYGEHQRSDVYVVDDQTMIDNNWPNYAYVYRKYLDEGRPVYLLPEGTRVARAELNFRVIPVNGNIVKIETR